MRLVPLAVVICLAAPAAAEPCDPAAAAEAAAAIDAHLAREARRARRWDNAWAITFAGLAAGQGALIAAEWTPTGFDDDIEAGLWVGVGKSVVGAASHLVLRLKVVRPERTGDACADLAAAERALRETARNERRTFWLDHLGSFALNAAGLVLLGTRYDTWEEGLKSFALGYPVGLLSVYTQPRASWHVRLEPNGVVLSGTF